VEELPSFVAFTHLLIDQTGLFNCRAGLIPQVATHLPELKPSL
jgi:hypothetical protein